MKTSPTGRAFIEAFEGKFLQTYDDGTGVLTIGYGHTTMAGPPAVYRGQTITAEQCDQILASDLGKVETNVSKLIKVPLSQPQFDALVSFDFNTGSLSKGSIATRINSGDNDGAMSTLLLYDHAGGKKMAGLTRRRNAEVLLYFGKVQKAMDLAGAHMPSFENPMPQKVNPAPPVLPPIQPESIWSAIAAFFVKLFKRK